MNFKRGNRFSEEGLRWSQLQARHVRFQGYILLDVFSGETNIGTIVKSKGKNRKSGNYVRPPPRGLIIL